MTKGLLLSAVKTLLIIFNSEIQLIITIRRDMTGILMMVLAWKIHKRQFASVLECLALQSQCF